MNPTRAGEIGVALIGLYALVMALVDIPFRVFTFIAFPRQLNVLSEAAHSAGIGPVELVVTQVGLAVACLLTLMPGVILILARRPIAARLFPIVETVPPLLPADELLRVGVALIGINLVLTGIGSLASVGAIEIRMPSVETRTVYRIAGPLVRVGSGLVLVIYSRWWARNLGAGHEKSEGA